MITALRFDN